MENREEILKRCANEAANCNVTYNKSGKGILKAMQEYSDQQNKHKLDEIERLKSRIIYWNELHSEVIKDNSKLQFELKAANSVNEQLTENQIPEYLIEFVDDVKHMIKLYNNSSHTRSEEYRDKLEKKLDDIRTIDV